MDDNIILFPQVEKLQAEVEKLKAELAQLVLEKDELRFVICRNIETAYMLQLGGLEYKAYQLQCSYLRLKRKIQLIQAKINRQEKIALAKIDKVLDEEFAAYQEKLEEKMNQMNEAIRRGQLEQLSPAETRELKKLYHTIVKALHPDLHPEGSEAQLELFKRAVTAYENGDLDSLRVISEMVDAPLAPDIQEDAVIRLTKDKARLTSRLNRLRDSISQIKSEFPYTYRELIDDPEWIAERKDELKALIAQYQDGIEACTARIEEMLRCAYV